MFFESDFGVGLTSAQRIVLQPPASVTQHTQHCTYLGIQVFADDILVFIMSLHTFVSVL